MNHWLLLCSPDKWFGDKNPKNAQVNEMLLTLDIQSWRVQERYFRDAQIGDKCILKVGEDKRSLKRRTLKNGDLVDVLESGIYAIGEIYEEIYYDKEDDVFRVTFNCETNLFLENRVIVREKAEELLESDYLSMSSKRISESKYQSVLKFLGLKTDKFSLEHTYPAQIKVDRANYSVYELKRQYEKRDNLILNPEFQRENVWTKRQKSELIESILMGIPLPIIYFSQNSEGKLQVVDGKQRLTALFDFLNNKFPLSELYTLENLKGKKFDDLDGYHQSELEDYQLIAYVIKSPTPERVKFDIFDRVNRGGTKLNNQEMRNALYFGKSTQLLKSLTDNNYFLKATDHSINTERMKDRYMILRFIAFYLLETKKLKDKNNRLIEYRSDIDEFLGNSMEIINRFSEDEIREIENIFNIAMKNSYKILGKNAFRMLSDSSRKRPINMALFESLGYLMSFDKVVNLNVENTKNSCISLFKKSDFIEIITYNVDSSVSVKSRFYEMKNILKGLKNDK